MRIHQRAALASALALVIAIVEGIGAPPSEFAPPDNWWWAFDPLMFPALFGGVIFALVALIASGLPSAARASAVLCAFASLLTGTGVVIAAGISEHLAVTSYAAQLIVVAIPVLISAPTLKRGPS